MMLADRIASVLLLVLSGFWIFKAKQLPYPKFAQVSKMGPGDFPIIVAAMLAIFSIWLFIDTFRKPVEKAEDEDDEESQSAKNPQAKRDIITGFGLFTFMLILMPFIGFALSALIFAFSFLLVIGRYKVSLAALIGVAIPSLLWFIFSYLLTVPLPKGPWGV